MPKHNHRVNAIDNDLFVTSVNEVSTPLMIVKKNLLLAGLFSGYGEGLRMCSSLPPGFHFLKSGVQRLMDNKEILFEKVDVPVTPAEEVSIVTIYSPKAPSKKPV